MHQISPLNLEEEQDEHTMLIAKSNLKLQC